MTFDLITLRDRMLLALGRKLISQGQLAMLAEIDAAQLQRFFDGGRGLSRAAMQRVTQVLDGLDASAPCLPAVFAKRLAVKLRDQQLILFGGAGLSHLCPPQAPQAPRLPLWRGLAEHVANVFADEMVRPDDFTSLPDFFDYLQMLPQGRAKVELALRGALDDRQVELSATHKVLGQLPWSEIWTTNYDELLERATARVAVNGEREFFHIREHERSNKAFVLHLHGTLLDPHTLGTQDYRRWEGANPKLVAYIRERLLNRTILFAGYGLGDPNLDHVLNWLRALTHGSELRMFGLFWQMPEVRIRQFEQRDRIEAVSLTEERQWHDAFSQIFNEWRILGATPTVARGRSASRTADHGKSSLAVEAAENSYARSRLAESLRARWDDSGIAHLHIPGPSYRRAQIGIDDIYVEPDLHLRKMVAPKPGTGFSLTPAAMRGAAPASPRRPAPADFKTYQQCCQEVEAFEADGYAARAREAAGSCLAQYRYAVVLGEPGSGKSLMLRFQARRACSDWLAGTGPMPVYLRLNGWEGGLEGDGAERLLRHLHATLPLWAEVSREQVQSWLEGSLWWLLDGLDEIRDAHQREQFRLAVCELARARPQDRITITARPQGYAMPLGTPWREFDLAALTDVQVGMVLARWERIACEQGDLPISAADIDKGMHTNIQLAIMRRNPLLLTLAVLFYRTSGRLPRDRWEYYQHADENLRIYWLRHRIAQEPLALGRPADDWGRLLGEIALDGMRRGVVRFSRQQLQEYAGRFYAAQSYTLTEQMHLVHAFVRAADDLIGVMIAFAPGEYGFLHLTLQEYHAARRLIVADDLRRLCIARHWDDPDWAEVWALYCSGAATHGEMAKVSALWQGAMDNCAELDQILCRPQQAIVRWAGLMGGEALHLPIWRMIENWLLLQLAPGQLQRIAAINLLCGWQHRFTAPLQKALLLGLSDSDEAVRGASVEALQSVAGLPQVAQALQAALGDPDGQVRWQAAQALQGVANQGDVRKALLGALAHRELVVRLAAVQALRSVAGLPEVRSALLAALGDPELVVCWTVAHALHGVVEQGVVRMALLAALKDSDKKVRWAAVEALHPVAAHADVQAAMLGALADGDMSVRLAAVEALQGLVEQEAVRKALLDKLQDSEEAMRWVVAQALQRISGRGEVRKALLLASSDSDNYVRAAALEALQAQAALPEVRSTLFAALEDDDENVRLAAIEGLHLVAGQPDVRATLLAVLGDADENVRLGAVVALQRVSSHADVRLALSRALGDFDQDVRLAAVKALQGVAGHHEVRRALLRALYDTQIRWAVVEALQSVAGYHEVGAALLACLNDADGDVRRAAASALQGIVSGRGDVRAALLAALADGVDAVRCAAVQSLQKIAGMAEVRAALLAILQRPQENEAVRKAAIAALSACARCERIDKALQSSAATAPHPGA